LQYTAYTFTTLKHVWNTAYVYLVLLPMRRLFLLQTYTSDFFLSPFGEQHALDQEQWRTLQKVTVFDNRNDKSETLRKNFHQHHHYMFGVIHRLHQRFLTFSPSRLP